MDGREPEEIIPDSMIYRFLEHLPVGGDPVLILLKGHLLIEELLRELINIHLADPQAIEEAELTFHHCLCLAKAFGAEIRSDYWIWQAIKKLNKLRNQLAHNLEPKGFDDRLENFVSFVEENTTIELPTDLLESVDRVSLAITTVHASLLGITKAYSYIKSRTL